MRLRLEAYVGPSHDGAFLNKKLAVKNHYFFLEKAPSHR